MRKRQRSRRIADRIIPLGLSDCLHAMLIGVAQRADMQFHRPATPVILRRQPKHQLRFIPVALTQRKRLPAQGLGKHVIQFAVIQSNIGHILKAVVAGHASTCVKRVHSDQNRLLERLYRMD